MNKSICLYHDDLDGYCSAAFVYNYHNGNIELHRINHGDVEFLNNIRGYDAIIFVDFTPPVEYIEKLSQNNRSLLILDHHKTASDRLELVNNMDNAEMILDTTHAGCMVTWNYYYFKESKYKIESATVNIVNESNDEILESWKQECFEIKDDIPKVVKLVEDYDIWKWEFNETEDFVNGMDICSFKNSPVDKNWEMLINEDEIFTTIALNSITEKGKIITEYKKIYNHQLLEGLSYEATLQGYKILVCNAPKNNSRVFGDRINDYPFVAMYSHKEDQYMVSLYSANDFDTTNISTQMIDKNGNRGGGHPGASGFRCEELPWELI